MTLKCILEKRRGILLIKLRTAAATGSSYSIPNVPPSSTAVRSFSNNISNVGYGGKSKRLKQVWDLKEREGKREREGE